MPVRAPALRLSPKMRPPHGETVKTPALRSEPLPKHGAMCWASRCTSAPWLAGAEVDVNTLFQRVRVEILFHSTDAALSTATRLSESRPTPWVHSDVLGLIAREGLRISPREVELG